MPRSRSSDSDDNAGSSRFTKWLKCRCGKIRLVNERCFMVPPLMTLGSALAEFVVVFSITGFVAIDVVGVSAVCFSVLLSLSALLFIRFDRLTILAFLMLFVSLLSSTTFLVICIQKQSHVHENGSALRLQNGSMESIPVANQSTHGSKLVDLMKSGSEIRWIHQLQTAERCCGFWNWSDWSDRSLLESNKSFKYHAEPIHPPTKWMVSCCDRNLTQDHSNCKAESIYDDWHDIVQYLFQKGCGSRMDEVFDEINYELLKTSLGLSFWELVVMIDVIVYTAWRKFKAKAHNACNGRGTVATEDDDVFT